MPYQVLEKVGVVNNLKGKLEFDHIAKRQRLLCAFINKCVSLYCVLYVTFGGTVC